MDTTDKIRSTNLVCHVLSLQKLYRTNCASCDGQGDEVKCTEQRNCREALKNTVQNFITQPKCFFVLRL